MVNTEFFKCYLYAKVYSFLLICLLLVAFLSGIYWLSQPLYSPDQTVIQDLNKAIQEWNDSAASKFTTLGISVYATPGSSLTLRANSPHDWTERSEGLLDYNSTIYSGSSTIFADNYVPKEYSDHDGVTVKTANFTLVVRAGKNLEVSVIRNITVFKREVVNIGEQLCLMAEKGCWDGEACHYYYRTTKVCMTINEDTLKFVKGCNGDVVESMTGLRSTDCQTFPELTSDIQFIVRSVNDPYQLSLDSDFTTVYLFSSTGATLAFGLILLSGVLMCFPVYYLLQKKPGSAVEGALSFK